MRKFVLEEKVISGSNIGEKVFIPRLSLSPSNVKIPFKFQRRQCYFQIFVKNRVLVIFVKNYECSTIDILVYGNKSRP